MGLGDTWLGDDALEVSRVARAVGRANDESLAWRLESLSGQQPAIARAQHGMATQASWRSAGSHRDENHIWRGGASAPRARFASIATAMMHAALELLGELGGGA